MKGEISPCCDSQHAAAFPGRGIKPIRITATDVSAVGEWVLLHCRHLVENSLPEKLDGLFTLQSHLPVTLFLHALEPSSHKVQSRPLVDSQKILLSPLHIKLGLMKNFVKALDREGRGFAFLGQKFPRVSREKMKAGILDGPQIRELMKDTRFEECLGQCELSAWLAFKSITTNFLGNHRSPEYVKVVDELMDSFQQLGARMSV